MLMAINPQFFNLFFLPIRLILQAGAKLLSQAFEPSILTDAVNFPEPELRYSSLESKNA
jgi:hypothetical protein